MAEAMGAASPALMSAVIQCINQPAASTEVQQAAIQVFRLTPIPEEVYSLALAAMQHSSTWMTALFLLINLMLLYAFHRAEQS